MSAEQTPDIADLAAVLADLNAQGWTTESDHDPGCPGDERYCMSHCPVPVQVRRGPDDLAAALAPLLAAAVREARAAELREAADDIEGFGGEVARTAKFLRDRADRITEPVSHEAAASGEEASNT